jgi:hypothetical protein
MPTYKITDPSTGKVLRVTGDTPPNEEELNQIFSSTHNQAAPPQEEAQDNPLLSFAKSAGNALIDPAKNYLSKAGTIVGGYPKAFDMIKRFSSTSDPVERAKIAQESMDLNKNVGEAVQAVQPFSGSAGRRLLLQGAGTAVAGLPALAIGGTLGGGLEAGRELLGGEHLDVNKIASSAGTAAGGTFEAAGLSSLTSPFVNRGISSVAGVANPLLRRLAQGVVGGAASTGETALNSMDKGEAPTTEGLLPSFAMGFAGGAAGQPQIGEQPVGPDTYRFKAIDDVGNIAKGGVGLAGRVAGGATDALTSGLNKVGSKAGDALTSTAARIGTGLAGEEGSLSGARRLFNLDPDDLLQSEKMAKNTLKMTTSNSVEGMARELGQISKNTGKYVKDVLASKDAAIGPQNVDEIVSTIVSPLQETSQAQTPGGKEMLQTFEKNLREQLTKGAENGSVTNLSTMDKVRTFFNGQLDGFYRRGQQINTDADILDFYKAKAALNLKGLLAEAVPEVKDAVEANHTAMVAYPQLSKLSNGSISRESRTSLGRAVKGVPLVGKVLEPLTEPFAESSQIKAARSSLGLSPGESSFFDTLKGYDNRSVETPSLIQPELTEVGGIPLGIENSAPEKVGKLSGTALDKNSSPEPSSESQHLKRDMRFKQGNPSFKENSSPKSSNDVGEKSSQTNVQAKYAAEGEKSTSTGRRNISPEVIKNVLETKGKLQRNKLLNDFPMARRPNTMSRMQQEKFLRLASKQKYL